MKDSYQEFYNYIIKVLSISKIGLVFSKDPYALSNYTQIEKLSLEMLENFEHVKFDRHNYFQRNIYPTKNVSLRVAVFNKENTIENLKKHVIQQNTNGKSENSDITVSICKTGFISCITESIFLFPICLVISKLLI